MRKLRVVWSCSDLSCFDFPRHEHRWKFTAWLCGFWQKKWEEGKKAGTKFRVGNK